MSTTPVVECLFPDLPDDATNGTLDTLPLGSANKTQRIVIALAIVRLLLAVFGGAANIIAAVVLTNRKLWSPTSMLLLSLVVYDAFYLLLVIPISASSISINVSGMDYSSYRTILTLCYPLRYIAQMASTYTTVTVTVERFLVILLPLKANSMWTRGKTRRTIIGLLIFSVVFNIPRCFDNILSNPPADYYSVSSASPGNVSVGGNSSTVYLPDPACAGALKNAPGCDVSARNISCSYSRRTDAVRVKAPNEGRGLNLTSLNNAKDGTGVVRNEQNPGGVYPAQASSANINQTLSKSDGRSLSRAENGGGGRGGGAPGPAESGGGDDGVDEEVYFFYTVVYQFYLTVIFLYLIPYTVIPVLNLQLLIALKRRKEETRRISVKHEHRLNSTNGGPSPTDKEDGLTYIVLGITFCYFICCILPTVYLITTFAQSTSDNTTSILINNAGETTLTINAATDFFFYCLLGRKFRRVFIRTFCPKRYIKKTKAMTLRTTVSYNSV